MRYLLLIGALLTLAVGVGELRAATLSTHRPVDPHSQIELVVAARVHGEEHRQTPTEMTEAVVLACRLEVKSDPVGRIEDLGDGHFRAVFRPSMDTSDRRQFRGCLEDWSADHLRIDVIRLAELARREPAP